MTHEQVAANTSARPAHNGRVTISEKIVTKIATEAANAVPGTAQVTSGFDRLTGRGFPRIDVELTDDNSAATVEAFIATRWPSPSTAVAKAVRRTITEWVRDFTGIKVLRVNVVAGPVVNEPGERVTRSQLADGIAAPIRPIEVADSAPVRSIQPTGTPKVRSVAQPKEHSARSVAAPLNHQALGVETPRTVTPIAPGKPRMPHAWKPSAPKGHKAFKPKAPKEHRAYTPKVPKTMEPFVPKVPEERKLAKVSIPTNRPLLHPTVPSRTSWTKPVVIVQRPKVRKKTQPEEPVREQLAARAVSYQNPDEQNPVVRQEAVIPNNVKEVQHGQEG